MIEWVVQDVKRSKQTFLSQVNSVITKACMLCIALVRAQAEFGSWQALVLLHYILLTHIHVFIQKWNSHKPEGTGCFVPTCNRDIQQSRPDQACRFCTNKKTLLLFILLIWMRAVVQIHVSLKDLQDKWSLFLTLLSSSTCSQSEGNNNHDSVQSLTWRDNPTYSTSQRGEVESPSRLPDSLASSIFLYPHMVCSQNHLKFNDSH